MCLYKFRYHTDPLGFLPNLGTIPSTISTSKGIIMSYITINDINESFHYENEYFKLTVSGFNPPHLSNENGSLKIELKIETVSYHSDVIRNKLDRLSEVIRTFAEFREYTLVFNNHAVFNHVKGSIYNLVDTHNAILTKDEISDMDKEVYMINNLIDKLLILLMLLD